MKIAEFLAEFYNEQFPSNVGPWIGFDAHDPPFTLSQMKQMDKAGIIILDIENKQYRLTMKAAISPFRPKTTCYDGRSDIPTKETTDE